jgi:hypothetical protein
MENRRSVRVALISKSFCLIVFLTLVVCHQVLSQELKSESTTTKIQGYFAIFHPIDGYNTPPNFKDVYVVGFPIGFNVFKHEKIGYSFELFPFIQADSTGSRISKIVFHPGVVYRLNRGFSCAARVAFESTGRYGLTQVLTKSLIKTKNGSFGVSFVVAERFGNEMPTSVSFGIGIGLSF